MKILIDTPEKLVLGHRPVAWSLALVAGTLLLVYAGMDTLAQGETFKAALCFISAVGLMGPALWFFVERVEVVLDGRQKRCTIRRRRMSGDRTEQHSLASITRAMVQTHKGSDEHADTHRVALVIGADTLANRHGLTRSYASGPQAANTVTRINDWLRAHRA